LSLPNFIKSLDYLQEHGFCFDNMRKGRSTIPRAGNGGFAIKSLEAMSIIDLAPLLPIEHHLLHVVFGSDGIEKEVQMNQLLLNYCFLVVPSHYYCSFPIRQLYNMNISVIPMSIQMHAFVSRIQVHFEL
jgi:hypothetical protein